MFLPSISRFSISEFIPLDARSSLTVSALAIEENEPVWTQKSSRGRLAAACAATVGVLAGAAVEEAAAEGAAGLAAGEVEAGVEALGAAAAEDGAGAAGAGAAAGRGAGTAGGVEGVLAVEAGTEGAALPTGAVSGTAAELGLGTLINLSGPAAAWRGASAMLSSVSPDSTALRTGTSTFPLTSSSGSMTGGCSVICSDGCTTGFTLSPAWLSGRFAIKFNGEAVVFIGLDITIAAPMTMTKNNPVEIATNNSFFFSISILTSFYPKEGKNFIYAVLQFKKTAVLYPIYIGFFSEILRVEFNLLSYSLKYCRPRQSVSSSCP